MPNADQRRAYIPSSDSNGRDASAVAGACQNGSGALSQQFSCAGGSRLAGAGQGREREGGPGSEQPPGHTLCDVYIQQIAAEGFAAVTGHRAGFPSPSAYGPGAHCLPGVTAECDLLTVEFLGHLQSLMAAQIPSSSFRVLGVSSADLRCRSLSFEISWDVPPGAAVAGADGPLRQLAATLRRQHPTPLKYLFKVRLGGLSIPSLVVSDLMSKLSAVIYVNNDWMVQFRQLVSAYAAVHPTVYFSTLLLLHWALRGRLYSVGGGPPPVAGGGAGAGAEGLLAPAPQAAAAPGDAYHHHSSNAGGGGVGGAAQAGVPAGCCFPVAAAAKRSSGSFALNEGGGSGGQLCGGGGGPAAPPGVSSFAAMLVLWVCYLRERFPRLPTTSALLLCRSIPPLTAAESHGLSVETLLLGFFEYFKGFDLGRGDHSFTLRRQSAAPAKLQSPPLLHASASNASTRPPSRSGDAPPPGQLIVEDPLVDRNLVDCWYPADFENLRFRLQVEPWLVLRQPGGAGGGPEEAAALLSACLARLFDAAGGAPPAADPAAGAAAGGAGAGLGPGPGVCMEPVKRTTTPFASPGGDAAAAGSSGAGGGYGAAAPTLSADARCVDALTADVTVAPRARLVEEIKNLRFMQSLLLDKIRFLRNDLWWHTRDSASQVSAHFDPQTAPFWRDAGNAARAAFAVPPSRVMLVPAAPPPPAQPQAPAAAPAAAAALGAALPLAPAVAPPIAPPMAPPMAAPMAAPGAAPPAAPPNPSPPDAYISFNEACATLMAAHAAAAGDGARADDGGRAGNGGRGGNGAGGDGYFPAARPSGGGPLFAAPLGAAAGGAWAPAARELESGPLVQWDPRAAPPLLLPAKDVPLINITQAARQDTAACALGLASSVSAVTFAIAPYASCQVAILVPPACQMKVGIARRLGSEGRCSDEGLDEGGAPPAFSSTSISFREPLDVFGAKGGAGGGAAGATSPAGTWLNFCILSQGKSGAAAAVLSLADAPLLLAQPLSDVIVFRLVNTVLAPVQCPVVVVTL